MPVGSVLLDFWKSSQDILVFCDSHYVLDPITGNLSRVSYKETWKHINFKGQENITIYTVYLAGEKVETSLLVVAFTTSSSLAIWSRMRKGSLSGKSCYACAGLLTQLRMRIVSNPRASEWLIKPERSGMILDILNCVNKLKLQ